jgi:hypothetical protein
MIRSLSRATLILFFVGAVAWISVSPAASAPFDGDWTVVIWTKRGECDPGYRYEVRVENGAIAYRGPEAIDVSGRVDTIGTVSVGVRRGDQYANGAGRLARNSGRGTWAGKSTSGECSGVWEAERR